MAEKNKFTKNRDTKSAISTTNVMIEIIAQPKRV